MIERLIKILVLLVSINSAAFAQTQQQELFTATVDRNSIAVNEAIELTLTLREIKGKERPDLGVLEKDFIIHRNSQSSNVRFINGQSSSSITWNLQITPKFSGQLTIPSFSVDTDQGLLKTKEITIQVSNQAKPNDNIRVTNSISKSKPYVNETLIYRVKIVSKVSLGSNELILPSSNEFLLEQIGEIQQSRQITNGIEEVVHEANYILTPLKSGKITIDGTILSGEMKVEGGRSRHNSFFSSSFGFFDQEYKAFSVSGKPITLDVKAAKTELSDWLPLHSLKISEKWQNIKNAKVGEPINRTITINAIGSQGNQLPKTDYVESTELYKSYADKPIIKDSSSSNGIPQTSTSISYTIIPQKSGEVKIPEIVIPWFDVNKHQLRYAKLAAKTLKIAPSDNPINNPIDSATSTPAASVEATQNLTNPQAAINNQNSAQTNSKILLTIIATLSVALTLAISYACYLKRKLANLLANGVLTQHEKNTAPKVTKIKAAQNIEQLQKAISNYAAQYLSLPKNCSLEEVKEALITLDDGKKDEIKEIFNALSSALYGGKEI
ncbi:MAG: BatD family protein, partial [Proteobacteria bacterium]|nr:BatD family protein [Pseudomonadota bacterium]